MQAFMYMSNLCQANNITLTSRHFIWSASLFHRKTEVWTNSSLRKVFDAGMSLCIYICAIMQQLLDCSHTLCIEVTILRVTFMKQHHFKHVERMVYADAIIAASEGRATN